MGCPDGYTVTYTDMTGLEQLIQQREDETAMARRVLELAERQETAKMGSRRIHGHVEESALMREWYREWFDKALIENVTSQFPDGNEPS